MSKDFPSPEEVERVIGAIQRSVKPRRPVLGIDICGDQLTWVLTEIHSNGTICILADGSGTLRGYNAAQRSVVLEL